ncbi:MAG: class B sortase [Lachnospiraceae bacterium]|nr:class B sortase [Lachnospiraceae bacterium]
MKEEGKYHNKKKKPKKKNSIFSTIVLIIAICVFCFSAFQLYQIFSSYKKGNDEYDKIKNLAITVEKTEKGEEKFKVDFNKLWDINPDTIGWIRFEEPSRINYPVVHSHNNKEYLTKLFGTGKNTYGTLFVDKDNSGDFQDKNTIIYGHRMKSGSMFGQLEKYMEESFYKEHPYFYIYTPDGKESKYQVISAAVVKDTSRTYTKTFQNDEEFMDYIDYVRSISNYQTDAEVTKDSHIVSLSTCTIDSNEDRFVLQAVKISER